MVINAGFYISSIAVTFGNCRPLEKVWHFWVEGTCIDSKGRDVAGAAINLVLDISILAIPQKIIWTLHMDKRRKIGVAIAFSVGLLYVLFYWPLLPGIKGSSTKVLLTYYSVIASAAGRLYTIVTLDYLSDITKTFNMSYNYSQTLHWTLSEVTGIFLVFCVPALPKIFADSSVISRITASWHSWMGLPQESPSKESNMEISPRNSGSPSDFQRRIAQQNNGNVGNYTGTDLNIAREASMEHLADGDCQCLSQLHILKTAQLNGPEDDGDVFKTSTEGSEHGGESLCTAV